MPHYDIPQNLAATLNDIAIAYRNKGDLSSAMIYTKKAVDAAEKEQLEYERAIFLNHWADILIEDGLFSSAIDNFTHSYFSLDRLTNNSVIISSEQTFCFFYCCSCCWKKLVTKGYKDNEECYMIEQNLAATLNDIAIAYRPPHQKRQGMICVIKLNSPV